MTERTGTTTADFLQWVRQQEAHNRLFELVDGEIVEKVASYTPSRIALKVGRFIGNWLDEHPIGSVTGADGSYIMAEAQVYMPDVGYISKARMPQAPEREVPMPPDLAVEVKSPTDSLRELRRKAENYIAFGTRLVWLVLPESATVEVYEGANDVVTLTRDDTLTGGAALPGFTMPVRTLFDN